jgi:hypothetical protein
VWYDNARGRIRLEYRWDAGRKAFLLVREVIVQ